MIIQGEITNDGVNMGDKLTWCRSGDGRDHWITAPTVFRC